MCRRCRRAGRGNVMCAAACINIEAFALRSGEVEVTREVLSKLAGFDISEEVFDAVAQDLRGRRVLVTALAAQAASVFCRELAKILAGLS
jgi:ABC-type amino acid transport system permease subunit